MKSFLILETWGLTPADLGMSWDDVDPAWVDSMMVIKAGLSDANRRSRNG